jgi:hypothetical protein
MKLYKYREWNEYTNNIIFNNEIYFPTKRQLNDPAEIIHPISFPSNFFDKSLEKLRDKLNDKYLGLIIWIGSYFLSYEAKLSLTQYFFLNEERQHDEMYAKYMHITDTTLRGFEAVYDQIESVEDALLLYALSIAEDYSLLYRGKENLISLMNKKLESLGILSLTTEDKSLPLWAHYGKNHTGIILIFNSEKSSLFSNLQPVEYCKKRPQICPDNLERILLTKHEAWKYESEYRLIKKIGGISYNLEDSLVGIILGENMDENLKQEIINKLESKNKSIEVYQAKSSLETYQINYLKVL